MSALSDTMLRDLPRNQILRFWRGGRIVCATTAHEMMREGRISGTLCLDQLMWAFDADGIETPGYSADAWAVAAQ